MDAGKNLELPLTPEPPSTPDGSTPEAAITEPIEAYCVRCRRTVDMLDPEAVWTSKGTPGTRGTCPECSTTVFRLGKTDAHEALERPNYVRVSSRVKVALEGRKQRALPATYISFDPADAELAERLGEDLEKSGIHTYIDIHDEAEPQAETRWAGGVHPALKDSRRMVVILSEQALQSERVSHAYQFFRTQKKPIVVVVVGTVEIPDTLRRAARINFSGNQRSAFRQLVSALSD